MNKVIGLCGAKGVGKDYFFKIISEKYPKLNIRKIAFADPIKQAVNTIFCLHDENHYDAFKRMTIGYTYNNSQHELDMRHAVREIGMLMRSYDPEQFTNRLRATIEQNKDATWIVTDVRFDNEIQLIRRLNGVVVKINRAGVDYDGHITETQFDDAQVDYVLNNTTNKITQYKNDVDTIFREITYNKNWSI